MKQDFKSGLILGLLIGVVVSYFISHLWLWLFAGIAIGFVIAASRTNIRSFSRRLRWGSGSGSRN